MRRSNADRQEQHESKGPELQTNGTNGDAQHLTGRDGRGREVKASANTATTERQGECVERGFPAGQPNDGLPPGKTSIPGRGSRAKAPAGAGAVAKVKEKKRAGERSCPAGQPEDGPPTEKTATPAGASGTATTSRKGYTSRAVVPAQKKEILSVAKAMHKENFATKVKEIFDPEREATLQALKTGVYVGWRCPEFTWDCFRVAESCRCFCGHTLTEHRSYTGDSVRVPCAKAGCGCRAFAFVPSRPEEVGEFRLRQRPGFEPESWRAQCRCKHSHEAHDPRGSLSCKTKGCGCPRFESSFLCAACDRHWEQHETFFDTEKSRREAGLPVGEAYLPFAEIPKLRNAVLTGSEDDTEYKALVEGGLAALPSSQSAEGSADGDTNTSSGFRPVYD